MLKVVRLYNTMYVVPCGGSQPPEIAVMFLYQLFLSSHLCFINVEF